MYYTTDYVSPVGRIKLAADGERLVGLWLEGQKYFAGTVKEEMTEAPELGIFKNTKDWLDRYFAGKKPEPRAFAGSPGRRIQAGCMGNPLSDPLWTAHYVRRYCKEDGGEDEQGNHVSPGSGRSSGP